MTVAVFQPDPILSRTEPRGAGSFKDAARWATGPRVFRPNPVPDRQSPSGLIGGLNEAGHDSADRHAVGSATPVGDQRAPRDFQTSAEAAAPVVSDEGEGQLVREQAVLQPQSIDDAALQELLALRYREGFEEGLAQGAQLAAQSSSVPAMEPAEAGHLMQAVGAALMSLRQDAQAGDRFEPLKRLALHLATEMVRTELSLSPRAIDGLVRRCVQALDGGGQAVVVELHPLDLDLLEEARKTGPSLDAALEAVQWRADPGLTRGSVRARHEQSAVEDLIEHRLAALVQDLRVDALRWQLDQSRLSGLVDAEPSVGHGEQGVNLQPIANEAAAVRRPEQDDHA